MTKQEIQAELNRLRALLKSGELSDPEEQGVLFNIRILESL